MLPSWTRSSSGICERPYFRATDTTSRRFAVTNRCNARRPSSIRNSSSSGVGRLAFLPRSADVTSPERIFSAYSPASIVLASSTSSAAVSSGVFAMPSR